VVTEEVVGDLVEPLDADAVNGSIREGGKVAFSDGVLGHISELVQLDRVRDESLFKLGIVGVDPAIGLQPEGQVIAFNFATRIGAHVLGLPLRVGTILCLVEVENDTGPQRFNQQQAD
jgi:hypothetical protein